VNAPGCSHFQALDERRLYGVVDGYGYCSDCWKAAGRPFPKRPPGAFELEAQEIRNRDRMLARGGTDRHLVRNGLA
jgi:hypothetical protein